ncbi:MAG TPA: thymidine phosphorylase, partial [Candidatus Xenobia bacterium]
MKAVELIRRKRNGEALEPEALDWFCRAAGTGEIADYQVSAFLMAAWFKGMTDDETAAFTHAMVHSGDVVDLSDIPGIKVDKHSTGGVGDTTTLIVAPIAAAAGLPVAKMSGRGLGHTGGTLDKLESIAGLKTRITLEAFKSQVRRIGLAVVGQTSNLVPADSKFYALRDVTATVDSIPLIASSIMSKKLAAGTDAIVLDVKCGRGAFMQTVGEAVKLSRLMVAIGTRLGRRVRAVITRMEAPLGRRIGNAMEVMEALEILRGEQRDTPLYDVSLTLASHLLVMGGAASDTGAAKAQAMQLLARGAALDKFRQMVEAQGGDARVVDDPGRLPQVRHRVPVPAPTAGFIQAVDALAIGEGAALLGAGRARKEDSIDPAVGVVLLRAAGEGVKAGDALAELHVNDNAQQGAAFEKVQQ